MAELLKEEETIDSKNGKLFLLIHKIKGRKGRRKGLA